MPWFALDRRGAIFLIDPATNELVLQVHRGLQRELLEKCGRFPVGQCLCGQAAASGQILFAAHLDDRHSVRYDRMTDHGHYCLPIKGAQSVIGVLNLYVPADHLRRPEEDAFLAMVATTIGTLIERRQLADQVKQQAEFDPLTELPNRALFLARLAREISQASRNRSEVVLMFLDLDRFKQVNDTLGHQTGDRLLKEAAGRIAACVRATDTVSRLGNDEFSVILPRITHQFYIEFVARRIIEQMSKPFGHGEAAVQIACSMGIAIYPHDAEDVERLLMSANTAMQTAKAQGGDSLRFFKQEMNIQAMRRLELEKALTTAVAEDQIMVYYQPKIDPASGKIMGMEALARWLRPGIGLVSPSEFIPLAEQTGLIIPLGNRVLEVACAQNRAWLDAGLGPLVVSVNLSPRQFRLGDQLVRILLEVLDRTGLPAHLLELEITEGMMLDDMASAIILLNQVRKIGIRLAVDDFGTGYSSLSALKHLPIGTLKIDRSFITDLSSNEDSAMIVATIISLAKQLHMRVVAEGVEHVEEVNFLIAHGCDEIQGYYYAEPRPATDFEAFVRNRTPSV